MKIPRKITVRNIKPDEMRLVERWGAEEGWNPGLRDADCYLAGDSSGFFIAEADGEPAGCVFAINFSEDLCMGGVFIVTPEYRGGRVGVALQKRAAIHAGNRLVGFDAVEHKVKNYSFFGFKPAYKIVRYEMTARPAGKEIRTVDLTGYPSGNFNSYDRQFFPADRARLMSEWIKQKPSGAALGIVLNGAIAGYGVIRKAYQGYRLEPLYADNLEAAEELLLALVNRVEPGAPVYLNIPLPNKAACELAEKYRMKPVIPLVRMYNRVIPESSSLPKTYSQMG
jgi:predicted N-acetyltransferase YhbS